MSFSEAPYGTLLETTFRVQTWNVWGRFGPWQERHRGIVRTMRDLAPDVVLLQESWIDDTGGDQATVLSAELGFVSAVDGGELLFGEWGLCSAVLSRWPISGNTVHRLPALPPSEWGGIAQRAVIDGPRGAILVYNVALDWPPHASAARQHSLRALADLIGDDPLHATAPLVVAGDFNTGPESDEIRMLVGRRETARPGFVLFDAWNAATPGDAGVTWSRSNPWAAPSLLPDQRIDYIFTGWPRRGGAGSVVASRLAGTEPYEGLLPSDHFAVVADIRY